MVNATTSATTRPVLLGVILMIVGMSFIGLVDAAAKELAMQLNGVQVAWTYFAAMLLSTLITIVVRGDSIAKTWRTRRAGMQWLRAGSSVGSLAFLFYSLSFMPLADATVISFLAPLIAVALAGPILGETIGWRRWTAVCLGLGGAMLVIRPDRDVFQWVALFPLVSAVSFATFNLATRAIGTADTIYTSLLYTSFGATLILSFAMPFVWQWPSSEQWILIFIFGAFGLFAHLLIAKSLQLAPVSAVAPINYVRLVWAVSIGYFWFGDVPDAWAIAGGVIIVASGLYAVYLGVRE